MGKIVVFRANNNWKFGVVRMEVEKATDKSVWVGGHRVARASERTRIFEEFGDAKAWLIGTTLREIHEAEKQLEAAKEKFKIAENLFEQDIKTETTRW